MSDKPFSKGAAGFSGTKWINPRQTGERVLVRLDDMPPGFMLTHLPRGQWEAAFVPMPAADATEFPTFPLAVSVYGATPAEAIEKLREKLKP